MSLDDYEESGAGAEDEEEDFEKPETDIEVGPIHTTMICSDSMRRYFENLTRDADKCYVIAQEARRKGFDPSVDVEIPRAQDLAARVEALVGPHGVAEKVRELSKQYDREQVALQISRTIAKEMVSSGDSKEKAVDQAIRTGLAVLTEGVLVAPLEGIIKNGVKIGKNEDGSQFLSVYYAGPIRSAGGTGQALSVLIADVVRRELGIGSYIATPEEVERLKEEIPAYRQAQHLQYTPNSEEIDAIARGCPIMITGESTERGMEVSGYRDQPRIETNGIRGGACLVIAEGLCLKAPKVQKHVKKLGIDGWEFIDRFVAKGKGEKETIIKPSDKYLEKTLAGRPILAHPSKKGGLRLRYGRARTGGIASTAIHPSLMFILDDFIAVGTQIAIERPGKATIATPCDEIDAPIVLLRSGDLVQLETTEKAKRLSKEVRRIIDTGEILVPFGEFAENNKNLVDSPYCIEWFEMEFEKKAGKKFADALVADGIKLDARGAFAIAEKYNVPLHPDYLLFWHDVSKDELRKLADFIGASGKMENGRLRLPYDQRIKDILIELCALHEMCGNGDILVSERYSYPLLRCCGLDVGNSACLMQTDNKEEGRERVFPLLSEDTKNAECKIIKTERFSNFDKWAQPPSDNLYFPTTSTLQLASLLSGVEIRARGIYRIGGRMGRPEKAAARMMKPAPHILFPVGNLGGPQRLLENAIEALDGQEAPSQKLEMLGARANDGKTFKVEIGMRRCQQCGAKTYKYRCGCGGHTEPCGEKMVNLPPNLKEEMARAEGIAGFKAPDMKGVKGVISDGKCIEPLEKGILRAKHKVHTFKDGTCRFDMTDAPLTHFRPKEIGTPVERLKELGYDSDYKGAPLERGDQMLELKAQDVVPSFSCGQYLVSVSKVVDDLMARLYGMSAFYNAKEPCDLIGHLVIGLAPHTSAGILGRIIGYTDTQVCYAHPFYHTGKRRNCFGGNEALPIYDGNYWQIARIGEFVELLIKEGECEITSAGDVVVKNDKYTTVSYVGGEWRPMKISAFSKHPGPKHLIRITGKDGRTITTTGDHPFPVISGDGLKKDCASRISEVLSHRYPIHWNTRRDGKRSRRNIQQARFEHGWIRRVRQNAQNPQRNSMELQETRLGTRGNNG